jgi:biopolymer transport protein ExbD
MAGANIDDGDEITGINITPMVDIMLVLLVIFMVTTSTIHKLEGMEIDKPDAASGKALEEGNDKIILTCRADGSTVVDGESAADDNAIKAAIATKLAANAKLQGVVSCDESAQVGKLVHLIDLLRDNGVKRYAIATEKPKPSAN